MARILVEFRLKKNIFKFSARGQTMRLACHKKTKNLQHS